MSSTVYGTEYKLQGKWVAKDKESAKFYGEPLYIEVDDTSAPKVSYETLGEAYYPQTFCSWHEDQLHWEIDDEIFTFHVLHGPGKLERPYQKYVTIENTKTESWKRYKLVEITEEEYEDQREWYKTVEDKIWCNDSQWENLPTKDRIDNVNVADLPADENGFIIKGTTLYRYDENIGGPIVNIPDGIKRIKSYAFHNCQSITFVHIPDSVSSIGDGCFSGCKNLLSVKLHEGLAQINNYMFSNCVGLQEIILPNSITSIGRDSFAHCESLEDVVMPEALILLADGAFCHAKKLKKITFNSRLQKIDFGAFSMCTALTELHIPASVTEIGVNAFIGCVNLESIVVEEGNKHYYSKNNCLICRENRTIVLACNDSVIPDDGSVERIYDHAFSNCKRIESIVIPETVIGIAQYAFSGCSSLKSVQLPKYLPKRYGDGLFENCSSLEQFEIPNWMTDISTCMFSNCERLKEIKIPDSVARIGVRAFSGCKALTELFIPKNVTRIGYDPWMGNDNGNFIGGCTSLRKLEVEKGNPVYHSKDNCIIETKTGTLFAILENGVIPNDGSVTKIGKNAFCACENMTEISLPECITEIGRNAFSELSDLKKINIPKGVNSIESSAFLNGRGEKIYDAVEEENGIYYIGNWALGLVRKKLEKIDLDDPFAPTWEVVIPDSGTIAIREGTVGICEDAFAHSEIQGVILPNSLRYICAAAFASCESLMSISIPESVEKIGAYAFNSCKKLKSVVIPRAVKHIGENAFRFCKSLENLVIPDVEIEIGHDAFGYCGDIPNMDIPERILKKLTSLSTDEDESEGCEDEEVADFATLSPDEDDLPF